MAMKMLAKDLGREEPEGCLGRRGPVGSSSLGRERAWEEELASFSKPID